MDKNKVMLMTRLAKYEQTEGRKYMPIAGYFRTDYISSQLLKSLIAGTVVFASVVGIGIFYKFELIMQQIYEMDLVEIVRKVGLIYIISMAIYLAFSYVLAVYRYKKARESLKGYYSNLCRLNKYLEDNGRAK